MGITALQEASEKGFTETVQLLVDYPGIDLNMQDTVYTNLIIEAIEYSVEG